MSTEFAKAFIEFQRSRPQNPMNMTDALVLCFGHTEAIIETALKKEKNANVKREIIVRQEQVAAAWKSFQEASRLP